MQTRLFEFRDIHEDAAFLESVGIDGNPVTDFGRGIDEVGPVGEHGLDGVSHLIQFFVRDVLGGQDCDAANVQVFLIVVMDIERLGR